MKPSQGDMRIYVACLASYNNGILHGCWIDMDQETDTINQAIQTMLAASPIQGAEEYAIHDHEGFEGLAVSEYMGIGDLVRLAAFVMEHGSLGAKLAEHYGGDLDEARTGLDERYFGEYERLSDFVEESCTNAHDIPEAILPYVDFERMGRDWEISDLIVIETGFEQVHVFGSH